MEPRVLWIGGGKVCCPGRSKLQAAVVLNTIPAVVCSHEHTVLIEEQKLPRAHASGHVSGLPAVVKAEALDSSEPKLV